MRNELVSFASLQEHILKIHDGLKGETGWREESAQALASRLVEELGEVLDSLLGKDPVCDFLIASLQDHVEESSINIRFNKENFKSELADVANFCMMLHDISDSVSPRPIRRNKTAQGDK